MDISDSNTPQGGEQHPVYTNDVSKYVLMASHSGQPLCKHSSIAGEKEGGCERYAVEVCLTCKLPFCPDHASVIDQNYCNDCLSPQTAELNKEPLVDTNGVTHKGIHITLRGPAYPSLNSRIYEMTKEQLESFIREERVKVNQAESVRDYHRIALGSAQLELEYRTQEEHRKLKGVKLPKVANGSAAVGASTTPTKLAKPKAGVNDLAAAMSAAGVPLTQENVMKFAAFLAANKKK